MTFASFIIGLLLGSLLTVILNGKELTLHVKHTNLSNFKEITEEDLKQTETDENNQPIEDLMTVVSKTVDGLFDD